MTSDRDKWTAFWLSLVVPGVGQLWGGSVSCLAWFVAAGGVAAFWLRLADGRFNFSLILGQFVSLAVVGLLSAEHAKRLRERVSATSRVGLRSRVLMRCRSGRAINVRMELKCSCSPCELWSRVADLPRFLTIDPFHERVTLMRAEPAAGVDVTLEHNAFGRRFLRFGRILSWRAGRGYTFSDFSAKGSRQGFPHVFCIEVQPSAESDETRSRLTIDVRGKWTSRVVPAAIGRWWVWLVCREHARLLRKGL